MPQFSIDIEALSPLAFPERKPGVQFRRSLPYVPGAALYGALAAQLARSLDSEQFGKVLRTIRCHNAYPIYAGDDWVRPLPQTALREKSAPTQKLTPEEQLIVIDSLYERVCWEEQQPLALIYSPTDNTGRPYEAVGRVFYTKRGQTIERREVTQRVLTRVAINRRRGVAEDRQLYSPMVISEMSHPSTQSPAPTRFRGSIITADSSIKTAFSNISQIGGRQTTGIGAVRITFGDELVDTRHALMKRIEQMNAQFSNVAAAIAALGGQSWSIAPRSIFTISLLSDAILLDDGWIPASVLSANQLKEATGIQARLLHAFASTTTVGGWNIIWQRPKPTNVAVTMGSVFVFQSDKQLSDSDCDALLLLQEQGVGERRSEGYGQVLICDPFHLEQ